MRGGLEKNISRLGLYHFLSSFHLLGGVLIPFYTVWGGLNMAQVLLLQSAFMIALFIFEIPTGALADRFGRRLTVVLSGIVTALSIVVYTITPRFELFLLGEVLFALGAALQNGADDALLVDTLKALGKEGELRKHLNRLRTISLVGIAVASPIGSVLAQLTDVRLPFLLTSVSLALASLVAAGLYEPPRTNGKKGSFELMREGLGHFKGNKKLQMLAFEMSAVSTVGYFVIWLNQAALMEAGVPMAYFGFLQAAVVGAQVAVLAAMPKLERHFGTSKVAWLFPALTGVGFVASGLLLMGAGPAALLAGSLMLAGGFGLTQEAFMQPSMQKLIPSEQRATVGSVVSSMKELGKGLANPVVGFAADVSLSATLLALGGVAMALAFLSPSRKALEAPE